MARQIEPDNLRQWLDEQRPVTVLDVRPDDEHAQWAIPGSLHLNAYHTPGHTDESTSYVLKDSAVFTGDTLFTKGVGRPDLHTDASGARHRAHALFGSLTRLRGFGADVLVLPGHASEPVPFDGQPIAATMGEVLRCAIE
jgi:glyoxylase-like metal-dependent hydrolase (beta-lactamase superfamily II)